METIQYVKWPVKIDRIEVRPREGGKTYLFYVNPAFEFGFDMPSVMTVLSGSSLAAKYQDLTIEKIDEADVITAKTILAAKEPGKTEEGPYTADDGTEYKTYGEYLLSLGTASAFEPKLKTPGIVFGDLPISDGVERFVRMKDGKPQKRKKTKQPIIATHTNVASMLMYTPAGWMGKFGNDQRCLESEVHSQVSAGLWQKITETVIDNTNTEAAEATEGEATAETLEGEA